MELCRVRSAALLLIGTVLATGVGAAGLPGSAGAGTPLATPAPPDDFLSKLVNELTEPAQAPPLPEPGRIERPAPSVLPLGRPDLRERRTTRELAPGVTLTV